MGLDSPVADSSRLLPPTLLLPLVPGRLGRAWDCATGNGQVAAVLADERTDALLALDEPDFTDGRLPW